VCLLVYKLKFLPYCAGASSTYELPYKTRIIISGLGSDKEEEDIRKIILSFPDKYIMIPSERSVVFVC
jgi:hypothetical protein